MQKIISLFRRNYEGDRLVRNEVTQGAEWVVAGEGVATRKYDGTCCMVKDGKLFKRYDAKQGKTPPQGFIPAQDPDIVTGHWPGWLPVDKENPSDKYHCEAFEIGQSLSFSTMCNGTYELCGEKINGNNDSMAGHQLIEHGLIKYEDAPRDYDGLKAWFVGKDIEGIVWHHTDGRMVKIKKKDLGLRRKDD